jgi:putative two-component system response regulator
MNTQPTDDGSQTMLDNDFSSLLNDQVYQTMEPAVGTFLDDSPPPLAFTTMLRSELPRGNLQAAKIAIIDDEPTNVKVVQKYLQSEGYQDFIALVDPTPAVEVIGNQQPDLVLLDVMMPHVSGLDVLSAIRGDQRFLDLPVIILTAATDRQTKMEALSRGATDFLTKPLDGAELIARVRNALLTKACQDRLKSYAWNLELGRVIESTSRAEAYAEVIYDLAVAAERTAGARNHLERVAQLSRAIAAEMEGWSEATLSALEQASTLHDVGKISLSEAVLPLPILESGVECQLLRQEVRETRRLFSQLSRERFAVLRSHPKLGADLLRAASTPLVRMAARIALGHHEHWDGSGYPLGLAGEQIPMEARIVAVADSLDLLWRNLREPRRLEEMLPRLESGRGKLFDPAVLDALAKAVHCPALATWRSPHSTSA